MVLFGTILKQNRKRLGLSQQHVADWLNVTKSTYHTWESDKAMLRASYLPPLAELFGVEITDLFPPGLIVKIAKADGQRDGISLDARQLYEDLVGPHDQIILGLKERVQALEAEVQRLGTS